MAAYINLTVQTIQGMLKEPDFKLSRDTENVLLVREKESHLMTQPDNLYITDYFYESCFIAVVSPEARLICIICLWKHR